jgi:hypothetical protein
MQIDDVSRVFLHVQNNYGHFFFFKHPFSLSNEHHSFSKLERTLILVIRKTKALEIGEIHVKTPFNTFVSNIFLILKIMNFENMFSTKVIHFDVIQNLDA